MFYRNNIINWPTDFCKTLVLAWKILMIILDKFAPNYYDLCILLYIFIQTFIMAQLILLSLEHCNDV